MVLLSLMMVMSVMSFDGNIMTIDTACCSPSVHG